MQAGIPAKNERERTYEFENKFISGGFSDGNLPRHTGKRCRC